MADLQTGLNILFNNALRLWNYFNSDSVPLVVRMVILAPFVIAIYSLIVNVFGSSMSGKTDL